MFTINGVDFELPTMAPNPKIGYTDEYVEKKMISGKIRRIYKGKRLSAEINFGYLTQDQIDSLYDAISSQISTGYVTIELTTADGSFNGQANVEISGLQSRYAYINGAWVWTNYSLKITGTDLES